MWRLALSLLIAAVFVAVLFGSYQAQTLSLLSLLWLLLTLFTTPFVWLFLGLVQTWQQLKD